MEAINTISSIFMIVMIIAGIVLLGSMVFMIRSIIRYYHLKGVHLQRQTELADLTEDNRNKTVEYSKSLLELIHMIITRIAVLKFRTFQDTHKMDPTEEGGFKVTKTHLSTLAADVAKEAHSALNQENFSLRDTFFTEEFYNKYIIDTSFILIKEMFAKVVDSLEEVLY